MSFSLTDIATLTEGHQLGEDSSFRSVSTDTRSLKPGDLFVALKGPNFNGNEFAMRAMSLGACGVMVDQPLQEQIPQVVVGDTLKALQQLGQMWRMRSGAKLVAVTGSNGKTTVKELLAAVLGTQGNTLKTEGNLNNHIGVPLTLLRLQEEKLAVIEMGASGAGEIAELAAIAKPDIAIVTNTAEAHLEGFGSREGVARAKGELFEALAETGVAIVNRDDPFASYWLEKLEGRSVIGFGFGVEADVRAEQTENGVWVIHSPIGSYQLKTTLVGKHNVANVLAATAAGVAMGIEILDIARAIESVEPVKGRLNFIRGVKGTLVIDDTYNANPASLEAAIDVLSHQKGKRLLVVGDMAELGEDAESIHSRVGEMAKHAGVNSLFAYGEISQATVNAFGENGFFFENQEELIEAVSEQIGGDVSVLIKGSRAMKMERVVQALSDSNNNNNGQDL